MNTASRLKKLEGKRSALTILIPELAHSDADGVTSATYTCGDYAHSEVKAPDEGLKEFLARLESDGLAGAQAAYPGAVILSIGAEDL